MPAAVDHDPLAEPPTTEAPPIPQPQRKTSSNYSNNSSLNSSAVRRPSFDPFNCAFVERHLESSASSRASSSNVTNSLNSSLNSSKSHGLSQATHSTPLQPTSTFDQHRPDQLLFSTITSTTDTKGSTAAATDQQDSFGSDPFNSSVFFDNQSSTGGGGGGVSGDNWSEVPPIDRDNQQQTATDEQVPFRHFSADHTSPEERNLFRKRSDPFANDDFFANS